MGSEPEKILALKMDPTIEPCKSLVIEGDKIWRVKN